LPPTAVLQYEIGHQGIGVAIEMTEGRDQYWTKTGTLSNGIYTSCL